MPQSSLCSELSHNGAKDGWDSPLHIYLCTCSIGYSGCLALRHTAVDKMWTEFKFPDVDLIGGHYQADIKSSGEALSDCEKL